MKKNYLFSFCLIIPLLSVLFASLSCSKDEKIIMRPVVPPVNDPTADTATDQPPDTTSGSYTDSAKFLALGDSYTIGQSVQPNERFPAQTVELLRMDSVGIQAPQYIATTGWTTTNLMAAINSQFLTNDYDVVTLLIGVNDQYQHHDTAGYAGKFEALLNKAITLAGGKRTHVFVLSIPDYSVTPFVSAPNKPFVHTQIDMFNAINKEITGHYSGVAYVDITPLTREAENDLSLLAFDELHPSGKEYRKWAEKLAPLIKEVLK